MSETLDESMDLTQGSHPRKDIFSGKRKTRVKDITSEMDQIQF